MYKAITESNELDKYLQKIARIFNISDLLSQPINKENIVDYYVKSELGYKLFHSLYGSMHMALSFDGVLKNDDYFGQVAIVQNNINRTQPTNVLELGSGNGVNSVYLAEKNPQITFFGVDLTPQHIASARRLAEALKNLQFENGDFHSIPFQDGTFDLVFEIESVCHTTDMRQALSEIRRVLKPGGHFILFDGFRGEHFEQYDQKMQTAVRLVEIAMATTPLWEIDKWMKLAEEVGFRVVEESNISTAIMPNLAKFQYLARGYFKYPLLSKVFMRVLNRQLVANSIAGLLMPFTINEGAQRYYKIVLQAIEK
jgi:ubiquinone/menaquinone biosynthesis C-methylase UbiE